MKRIVTGLRASVILVALVLLVNSSKGQGAVSFQVFYDQLSPYGSWVNYNQYGYVWIPTSVSRGFRPYGSSGRWIFTADGWTWMSDYSWGWAPFHYGNWFYDDVYGWMWSPGYEWAPAWVTWGEYGGNYGWAPIGPNIQIGVAWNTYRPPVYYWTFLPRTYMGSSSMTSHYVHYNTNVTIINKITVINNINSGSGRPQYMRGPQASYVERYTRTKIRPVTVRESSRPGRGEVQHGQVSIYRPVVNRAPAARPAAPPRVHSLQAVKPATLPGYNQNARPVARPATGSGSTAPSRPTTSRPPARPAPGGNRPSVPPPTSQPRPSTPPSRPAPPANRQPVRPLQNNHPAPHPTPRPTPNQEPKPNARPVSPPRPPAQQHQPRPAPQQPHTAPLQQRPEQPRPAPQEPRASPQEAPRPAPAERSPR